MNNKQLRGTRLGSISHESEEGVDFVEIAAHQQNRTPFGREG